jgi:hypothetical protein
MRSISEISKDTSGMNPDVSSSEIGPRKAN